MSGLCSNNFSPLAHHGGRTASGAFLGAVFWDVPIARKSSEHSADLSVFRQKTSTFDLSHRCTLGSALSDWCAWFQWLVDSSAGETIKSMKMMDAAQSTAINVRETATRYLAVRDTTASIILLIRPLASVLTSIYIRPSLTIGSSEKLPQTTSHTAERHSIAADTHRSQRTSGAFSLRSNSAIRRD